jgi:hypothetical protein
MKEQHPLEIARRVGAVVVLGFAFVGLAGYGGAWLRWTMLAAVVVLMGIVVWERRRHPDSAPDARQSGLLLALIAFLAITTFFD